MRYLKKRRHRYRTKTVFTILAMFWLLFNTEQSISALDLAQNMEQLNQQMEKVFEARKNCSEICASIPVESDKYFLANSAREIISVIIIRLKYEQQLFEMMAYIQDSHKKTEFAKRINSYGKVRGIAYKELEEYRELKTHIKDDNVLYYFDEAEEAIIKAIQLFDNSAYSLKAEI